ncbi:MAG: hypothetical protein K8U03_23415 [Planctomycetia bacterium]|nr:hypothetical protein [Planctomycetia bacterium]
MDFRRQALLIIVALTSVLGCRHNQAANRELLERELRLQEDRIYQLEGALEDAQRELCRSRGIDPDTLPPGGKPTLGGLFGSGGSSGSTFAPPLNGPSTVQPGSSSGTGSTAAPSVLLPPTGDTAPPAVQLPSTGAGPAPPFRGAPIISPPDPTKPEGIPTPGATPGAAPPFKPGGAQHGGTHDGALARREPVMKEMSSPKFVSPGALGNSAIAGDEQGDLLPTPLPADLSVKTISLNRRTGGWNSDGKPGDDGILVVIEPRNARGEVVPTPGSVSLVVIDPAAEGDAGRFARWDFTASDAGALVRPLATGGSGGLHFELPWPETPPAHARLKLFIRFHTDDGRRLQAEKDLVVDLGTGSSAAWKNPLAPPLQTATRANAAPPTIAGGSTNKEAGAVQPATLHWGAPKPAINAPRAEVLIPTTDAPLRPVPDPSFGPMLVAPGN